MLIDTMISLPQDSLLAARPLGSSQIGPTEGYSAMPGSSQCALFVLVSSAQGLPLLPAAASTSAPQPAATDAAVQTRAPSAFVAVKAARDIVNGGAVQGTTRVVGQQCNPVWSAPIFQFSSYLVYLDVSNPLIYCSQSRMPYSL